jgi:hypothetical protein
MPRISPKVANAHGVGDKHITATWLKTQTVAIDAFVKAAKMPAPCLADARSARAS